MPVPTGLDLQAIQHEHDRLHQLVAIDKYKLDDELATQAVKFRDVCDAATLTISYLAAAKDNFDQIEAQLLNRVREDHERETAGVEKPGRLTVDAAKALVMVYPDWIEAKAIRRDWETMNTRIMFLKETYSQRSSNMKELPTLFAAGYWQTDSATGQPRSRGEVEADLARRQVDERRQAAANGTPTERRRPR